MLENDFGKSSEFGSDKKRSLAKQIEDKISAVKIEKCDLDDHEDESPNEMT